MDRKAYKYRSLERVVKGFANHRRLQILNLLRRKPELSVFEISDELNANFKTIAVHVQRLATAGLVLKRSVGSSVRHKLTPKAISILKFLRTLE